MEDLAQQCNPTKFENDTIPELTQYGIKLPSRVAVVGQTDSGKTHSIMHRWLGRKILYWRPDKNGTPISTTIQHCLFCSNRGMSTSEKETLVQHFVTDPRQRLFHMSRFPTKQDVFDSISRTSIDDVVQPKMIKKRKKNNGDVELHTQQQDPEDIVFSENEKSAPSRVIVFGDFMMEAFSNHENEATMNLLTTKLSHHNNVSILTVCHELYPKGKNSVLFCDQLTGVHLHAIANQQRIHCYIYGFLSDDAEKRQFDHLFNEHVLCVNDSLKGNRRGSIFIRFTPGLCTDHFGTRKQIGRFLTFNECDFSAMQETFDC